MAVSLQRAQHCTDRQSARVSVRAGRVHRLVDGLAALVVGDSRIAHIECDALNRDVGPTLRLAQCHHKIGCQGIDETIDLVNAASEATGHLRGNHLK